MEELLLGNPYWHTPQDTVATIDWDFYVPMTQSLVALVAHEAELLPEPADTGGHGHTGGVETGTSEPPLHTGAPGRHTGADPSGTPSSPLASGDHGCRCDAVGAPVARALPLLAALAAHRRRRTVPRPPPRYTRVRRGNRILREEGS